ncbi:MAG: hypothetical protein II916_04720 [Oscillospiraceae bacterium]|nr:hypothetical protein [Oscillospiraceae bacterium]
MAQLIPYHMSDTFSYSKVTAIDSSGILFDDGQSIFFQECALNFARWNPEESGKCVAERDKLADIPYFEFYTCGKSMILQFDGVRKFALKQFDDLRERLESYGYTTYDLA